MKHAIAMLVAALMIEAGCATVTVPHAGKEPQMNPTITCGKHLAENANLAGSRFHNVNLSEAQFDDVNMAKTTFHNINLSDITVTAVQIGGARFQHIGLPPGSPGRQRPVSFDQVDLNTGTFSQCDLSNVKIDRCKIDGMTIDGIPVADLLAAYRQAKK